MGEDSKSTKMSALEKERADAPAKVNPILRYDEYYDYRTYSYKLKKTAKPEKRLSKKQSVLVVRRIVDEKGRHVGTKVDIKSFILADVLREINKNVEGTRLSKSPPEASLDLFFHSRIQLETRLQEENAKSQPDADLVRDVSAALGLIAEDHKETIENFDALLRVGSMTWELLWALFKPNCIVYHRHILTEQNQLMTFKSIHRRRRPDGMEFWKFVCDLITSDGNRFGLAKMKEIEIDAFEGAYPVTDLAVLPLEYMPDQDVILKHSIARGKNFVSLVGHNYREISGAAMREATNAAFQKKRLKFNSYGRVMIDPAAFRTFCPDVEFNYEVHKKLDRDKLTDVQHAICTPLALGFCFGVKMWGAFPMDRLVPINWTDEAFPSLVLDPEQKGLIHSLVSQHSSKSKGFDDVVQGKGRGLIGLLSGLPGSGKTLTAEAVSEETRRPLYTVSAGELGVEPEELDKHLTMILELSANWDAVLLLDEADVFLQARNNTDIQRNALVSIFLRQLEYYQGILILTTNRIGSCDPAFESRIHFSVHYPTLSFEARRKIWRTFWTKATSSRSGADITDEQLDILATPPLNGRQVKNAVSSAQSLALEQRKDLSIEHVQTVLKVVQNWHTVAAREGDQSSAQVP